LIRELTTFNFCKFSTKNETKNLLSFENIMMMNKPNLATIFSSFSFEEKTIVKDQKVDNHFLEEK